MAYNAKIYKVFIACPSDVQEEKEAVRSAIAKWNAMHSEEKKIVLLPISWEINAAPEGFQSAQDYINESILDTCDILIGIFWSTLGQPTKHAEGGSVEELERHISRKKLAMLYFSTKELPQKEDKLDGFLKVLELKKKYQKTAMYSEFNRKEELENKVYEHLVIHMNHGKIRSTFDSDILAQIKDDKELAIKISNYYTTVSANLLKNIVDEKRADIVWDAMVDKLKKSPAELRESLLFLALRGAFKHRVYIQGTLVLSKADQSHFGIFMENLYSINKYEFYDLLSKGVLEDSPFKNRLMELIKKQEG